MTFPPKVKEDALVACGRHCCLCHRFRGIKMEVHHIKAKSEGGKDTIENAIALCLDCHADMTSYDPMHPKGSRYTRKELVRHRDAWHKKVSGSVGLLGGAEAVATDKIIFLQLTKLLPWNGSIQFVRVNNFNGFSFALSKLDDLEYYREQCSNPAFEFIDADLEGLRNVLRDRVLSFLEIVYTQTFTTNNPDRNAVPDEWLDTMPDRFERAVKQIDEAAVLLCETYDSLVRLAVRKLGVIPEPVNS